MQRNNQYIAPIENITSLKVSLSGILTGQIQMHAPATTSRMNAPAPSRAPIASDDVSAVADVRAAIAPNISAAPFPSATKVIPAIFSFKFNVAAIQFNAGTK